MSGNSTNIHLKFVIFWMGNIRGQSNDTGDGDRNKGLNVKKCGGK
jgi:hypothetical protein